MRISDLQRQVDTWMLDHGGYWNNFQIMARLTEEIGALSSALQRAEGLRPRHAAAGIEIEAGDILFTLAAFANVTGLDLERAAATALSKYSGRDSADRRGRSS